MIFLIFLFFFSIYNMVQVQHSLINTFRAVRLRNPRMKCHSKFVIDEGIML